MGASSPLIWNPGQGAPGARRIPLNQDALEVLRRKLGGDHENVFAYHGKLVAVCSTLAWKRSLAKAGISDFRWHDLRHTWASWHVQSGTSLQELMELGAGLVTRWS